MGGRVPDITHLPSAGVTPPNSSADARGRRDAVQTIPPGLHVAVHENPPVTQKRNGIPTQ